MRQKGAARVIKISVPLNLFYFNGVINAKSSGSICLEA